MFLHQGISLDVFNELPVQKATHALYECCNSVVMARALAGGRPYRDHDALFCCADESLYALSEESVDAIREAYLHKDAAAERTRDELAQINRTRLERMLGPEGGYRNW